SKAKIMFVGLAPGREEDKTGKPFVGRAGKFLNELLRKNKITRKKIFITIETELHGLRTINLCTLNYLYLESGSFRKVLTASPLTKKTGNMPGILWLLTKKRNRMIMMDMNYQTIIALSCRLFHLWTVKL
ncbi:MAG: hypothetical protein HY965_08640, partial [Ignavibacteriales bacterium]|nr:hypothetical protein [Ignavibacteriales bacterium]